MIKDKLIKEEVVEYKVYKEKPYLNSDRDPLGVTINGKTKEYLHAHDAIKKLVFKGKQYSMDKGKMKVLDATQNKGILNAIVEVSTDGENRGNAELKVYNPSNNKKKGATPEMRKMSGFEYEHVQTLKNLIILLLDSFILGNDIEHVLDTSRIDAKKKSASKVTSRPRLFACDLCNWQTRFASALKVHKSKIHNHTQVTNTIRM